MRASRTTSTAYTREQKSFGIRFSRKPQTGYCVAGVVAVVDREGKGFVYIKFSGELERAVGKALPFGVGPEHPAHLLVVEAFGGREWRVFAQYLDGSKKRALWYTTEKPVWLHHVRRATDGNE